MAGAGSLAKLLLTIYRHGLPLKLEDFLGGVGWEKVGNKGKAQKKGLQAARLSLVTMKVIVSFL